MTALGPSSGDLRGCCTSLPTAPHLEGCPEASRPDVRTCCATTVGVMPHAHDCPRVDFEAPDFTADERALSVVVRSGGAYSDGPSATDAPFTVTVGEVLDQCDDDAYVDVANALRLAVDARCTLHRVTGFVGSWFAYEVPDTMAGVPARGTDAGRALSPAKDACPDCAADVMRNDPHAPCCPALVASDAREAFWQTVADRFPAAESGDLPIGATEAFEAAALAVVREWLNANRPRCEYPGLPACDVPATADDGLCTAHHDARTEALARFAGGGRDDA